MKLLKRTIAWIIILYLRFWAKLALAIHRPKVIGIAGSVGKSSTRNAVATVVKSAFPIRVIETNSETGLPLGLLGIKPLDYSPLDWLSMCARAPFGINHIQGAKYLVIEMGIDDPYPPKNMEYLLSIVKPNIGIITYESAAHSEQFAKAVHHQTFPDEKSRHDAVVQAIATEDLKLLQNPECKYGIVNSDNPPLQSAIDQTTSSLPTLYTFGISTEARLHIANYRVSTSGTTFKYILRGTKQAFTLTFSNFCLPDEYAGTFAAALLTAEILGIELYAAKNMLEKNFRPPKGRAGIFEGVNGMTILDSSYNASKPTTISYLNLLGYLHRQTRRPSVAILADMLELGFDEQIEHEEVAKAIPESVQYMYLVGPRTKKYILPLLQGFKSIKDLRWFETARELNSHIQLNIPKHAIVLVKGSQGQLWLEESIKLLLKNKSDINHLCRQDIFWQKRKKAAGRWIEI